MSHQDRTSRLLSIIRPLSKPLIGCCRQHCLLACTSRSTQLEAAHAGGGRSAVGDSRRLQLEGSIRTGAKDRAREYFAGSRRPAATYQGFMKMLRKWHAELQLAIIPHVRTQMTEVLPGQWKIAGYVVFAGDGSRIELARTESLEEAFSPQRKKKHEEEGNASKRNGASSAKNSAKRKAARRGARSNRPNRSPRRRTRRRCG